MPFICFVFILCPCRRWQRQVQTSGGCEGVHGTRSAGSQRRETDTKGGSAGGPAGEVCSTAGCTSDRQHLRRSSRADPASQAELLRWPVL